jgi:hypothetical protein
MQTKLYLILLFICITNFCHSQSQITPAPDDANHAYCPLLVQGNYPFTTTIVPNPVINPNPPGINTYSAIDGQGNFTLTFADAKGEHSITIHTSLGDVGPFKFKYVNTLDGIKAKFSVLPSPPPPVGYDGSVPMPLCYTTPLSYTTPLVYYQDNTGANYGTSMHVYEWQAPKGWLIDGKLSTGSNLITGGPTATITPDPISTGALQVRAQNDCSSTLKPSDWFKISIPRAVIAIVANNVNPLNLSCGNNTPVTFTLQNADQASCITGYTWNIGSPNGWLYQNVPAPATINTTTNSISLTPAVGTTAPGNVSVTPLINGVAYSSSFTETVNFSSAIPTYNLSGAANICSSEVYSLDNSLVTGSSVTWSVTPATGLVTVTPLSATTVQLTRVGSVSGSVTLTASISNPCTNAPSVVTKTGIIIGTPPSQIVGPYDSTNTNLVTTMYAYSTYWFYAYEGTTNPPPSTYSWTLTPPAGSDNFPMNFSGSPIKVKFPGDVGQYMLKVTKSNSCGSAITSRRLIVSSRTAFLVKTSPNPATNTITVTAEATGLDGVQTLANSSTTQGRRILNVDQVKLYNVSGALVRTVVNKSGQNVVLDVSDQKPGIYFLEVYSGKLVSRQNILVQH